MKVFLYAFASHRGVPQLQLFPEEMPTALMLRALPKVLHRWELTGTTRARQSLDELREEFECRWYAGTLPPDNIKRPPPADRKEINGVGHRERPWTVGDLKLDAFVDGEANG